MSCVVLSAAVVHMVFALPAADICVAGLFGIFFLGLFVYPRSCFRGAVLVVLFSSWLLLLLFLALLLVEFRPDFSWSSHRRRCCCELFFGNLDWVSTLSDVLFSVVDCLSLLLRERLFVWLAFEEASNLNLFPFLCVGSVRFPYAEFRCLRFPTVIQLTFVTARCFDLRT